MAASVQFVSQLFVRSVWALNKILLIIGRSPVTRAFFQSIARVFKVSGRLFIVAWLGIRWILESSVAIFSFLGNFARDPKNTSFSASSIQFPSFGRGLFGDDDGSEKSEKSEKKKKTTPKKSTQITANRNAAKRRLPPPKPVKKSTPALPVHKGAKPLSVPGRKGAAGGDKDKDRELGYFEDQAF